MECATIPLVLHGLGAAASGLACPMQDADPILALHSSNRDQARQPGFKKKTRTARPSIEPGRKPTEIVTPNSPNGRHVVASESALTCREQQAADADGC